MTSPMADVRYALRGLRRSPGFTAAAIATLALGIGANTAVFSIVRGVLLSPAGFPDADRLMALWEKNPKQGYEENPPSVPDVDDWRRENRSFEGRARGDGGGRFNRS